jgi:hypothetical protein
VEATPASAPATATDGRIRVEQEQDCGAAPLNVDKVLRRALCCTPSRGTGALFHSADLDSAVGRHPNPWNLPITAGNSPHVSRAPPDQQLKIAMLYYEFRIVAMCRIGQYFIVEPRREQGENSPHVSRAPPAQLKDHLAFLRTIEIAVRVNE